MSQKEITKEYSNGELTVVWKPSKCMHAKVCVSMLPNVYDPNKKPWITAENASTEELKTQINKCPSGALSYFTKGEKPTAEGATSTTINVAENGPLIMTGPIEVTHSDGKVETKTKAAFCRCGASNNKPYCDGSHVAASFKG